jgi:hypothetical protein
MAPSPTHPASDRGRRTGGQAPGPRPDSAASGPPDVMTLDQAGRGPIPPEVTPAPAS